ncbi:MAG: SRPBCC family protein [Gammaproteobacteria bacterium]|nr:SRPBCC family protein [Gammaproteobacteria bacterium]
MLDPIKKTIDVPCSAEDAFETFVNRVTHWWPRDKNSVSAMNGEVAKSVVIEPRLNGEVYEIGHDDTKHLWGSVTTYDPGKRLVLDWHIGLPADNASVVEVLFDQQSESTTTVTLIHSRWEVFGDKAADMRNGYNQGWVGVFEEAYRRACQA